MIFILSDPDNLTMPFREKSPYFLPVSMNAAKYLSKFEIYTEFTKKDCQHWFIRRAGIIESFVLEKDGKICDFFSFYNLPSNVLKHKKYQGVFCGSNRKMPAVC